MIKSIRWKLNAAGWVIMGHSWSAETQNRQFEERLAAVAAENAARRAAGRTVADDIFDALQSLRRRA